jgi:hypothetical protein
LRDKELDVAFGILRSLVRGFVLHEAMDSVVDPSSYDESYESAINVFIAGLTTVASKNSRERRTRTTFGRGRAALRSKALVRLSF